MFYRYAGALCVSWVFSLLLMPRLIGWLKKWHFGQEIRKEGPESHKKKAGTPIMGGLGFIFTTVVTALVFDYTALGKADFWIMITALVGYGVIGFIDDYLVVKRHDNEGLVPKKKFALQLVLAVILTVWYMLVNDTSIHVPFTNLMWDLGWFFPVVAVIMLTGETNAVNLTDGLDGLSSSLMIIALIPLVFYGIRQGDAETAILLLCMIGSLLGYLHYNKYPCKVMMGDTGSLAMGGIFSGAALILKQEIAILVIGAVFIAEVLSVMIQVTYFRKTGGKRFFRMAPLHHHFELGGMKETKVVQMFDLWGLGLAVVGIIMGLWL